MKTEWVKAAEQSIAPDALERGENSRLPSRVPRGKGHIQPHGAPVNYGVRQAPTTIASLTSICAKLSRKLLRLERRNRYNLSLLLLFHPFNTLAHRYVI